MKTCPKCNEILGDSVKVCVKCRYQFEQDELQEALDRGESVKKFSQDRMDAERWNNRIIVFVVFLFCMNVAAFIFLGGTKYEKVENGMWVGGSILIPYEYTVYWDHVEINNYYGKKQEVDIPDNLWGRPVTVIGDWSFALTGVVKVKIPKSVVEIGIFAFEYCPYLTEVTGGKEVRVVGEYAFHERSKLEVVDLGTKIERIEDGAFDGCEQLRQFPRQDKLEYIGMAAFAESGLEEFEFNSGADVQCRAFFNTPWQDMQSEQFLVFGDGALLYYNGPEGKVFVPDGVKTMLANSIVGLTDSEIFLPQTVQKIDSACFRECTNIKIYIPSNVEEIKFEILTPYDTVATIVTTKGSHAEEYAKEHEIPCEIVEGW